MDYVCDMLFKTDYKMAACFYSFLFITVVLLCAIGFYLTGCTPRYKEPCQKILVEIDGELYQVNEHFLFPPH